MSAPVLSRGEWATGILALVASYTQARETVLTTTVASTRRDALERAGALYATLSAALLSGTLPSPGLDAKLHEAFGALDDDEAESPAVAR